MRNWTKLGGLSLPALMLLAGCGSVDVTGVVRDETTQRPIEGALVRIGEESTATDSAGFYSLEVDSDDEDTQRFNVQAPGYMAVSDVRLVDDDVDPARIDFDLRAESDNMQSKEYQDREALRQSGSGGSVEVQIDSDSQADGAEVDANGRLIKKPNEANNDGAVDSERKD